jgi:formate dehydrogenase major subunit
MCESCSAKGSKELYANMSETIKKLKMDSFINVKTITLKGYSSRWKAFYITLNGQQIDEAALGTTLKGSNKLQIK